MRTRGKNMDAAVLNAILMDVYADFSIKDISNRYGYSENTIVRVKAAIASIDALDLDDLQSKYSRGYISRQMCEWAKDEIYRRLDALTTPDEKEEPVKEELAEEPETVPAWFSAHSNILPELSAIFKMLSVAIDTMLDVYAKEGKEG